MAPALCNLAHTNSKLLPLVSARIPGRRRFRCCALSSPPTFLSVATSRSEAQRASSVEADIRTHLLRSLPATQPPVITDPMRDMLSAAPKTIAPALCLAACELVGGRGAEAMDAACAVYLMHAVADARSGFLSLPGPRAGRTKSSFPFSRGIQLMAVDALIPLGFEIVARSECIDQSRVQRAISELAAAMGAAGVPAGLYMAANEAGNFVELCKKKDGRLSACAAACGAIVGGGSDEEVERLRRFGLYAGMMHGLLSADAARRSEVADAFRSLARSELEGFEEGKVREVRELMDCCYEAGAVPATA